MESNNNVIVVSLFAIDWRRVACIAYFVSYTIIYFSLYTMHQGTSGTSLATGVFSSDPTD